MKKATLTFLVCWLGAFSPAVLAGDNRPFDRAQRAMQQKDYKAAITLCLGMLEQAPGDYDVNFLLAQAYSRSGDRERAMAVLGKMETQFPKNSDVIIFVARIHAWKGHYGEAMARYQEVLEFAPGNEEALVGTADIAARQKNHARAFSILQQVIERNPGNADAYYHLGLVHQWEGNTGKAKENFEKAAALDPGNEDYRVILTRASPRLQRKDEIRYGHEVEDWSDGRRDFQNDRLALHLELPRQAGVLILRYQQTHRFGETDRQFGLEAYPRLWRKAYGRFDLGFAPKSDVYPRLSYLAEVYQGLFAAAEASLGVWRMNFPDRPVTAALGSLGYYLGNYYPYVRANYCRENGNTSISWVLNVRRYFSAENFIYAGYGSGTRLLDDLTIQDLLPDRSDIYLAGVTWYVFDKIRIEFHFSRIRGNSLSRTTFQLSTGYRWR
jgi:YaiO family outer membrane protein